MVQLSRETEALAIQVAKAQSVSVDTAVHRALRAQACMPAGEHHDSTRRRMSVAEMLGVGSEISELPLLDTRSPNQIMDDLNAQ
jgi:antitoxin VapB